MIPTFHYSGTLDSFRIGSEQYARLELSSGSYVWFKFDFYTESYCSLDNESYSGDVTKRDLESAYQLQFAKN